jgi:hypothetical protein
MNNTLLRIKFQQRLNKLASFDYDNIECWQIAEAFNKAQREWYRRQVHGVNLKKESSEQTLGLIDDLQQFVRTETLSGENKKLFFESLGIPEDYAYFIKVGVIASKEDCKNRSFKVYLAEEANADILLRDVFKGPSFEWGETFATMHDNFFRVYTNDDFDVESVTLSYYRKPLDVTFDGCVNPATGVINTSQECEFKDDVTELIIDAAVAIIAADIESFNQFQRAEGSVQKSS